MSPWFLLAAAAIVGFVLKEAGADCPELEQCVSSARNETNVPFSSLAMTERSGRCLTVCSEQVEGVTESLVTSFGVWRSVDDSVLQSDSCRLFYEHKGCQFGCALRPSNPVGNDCRDTCFGQCKESCSFTQSCGSSCPPDCRNTWCRNGCSDAAIQLTRTSDALPASPLEFTLEPILENGGRFEITSVTASQERAEGISAFIWIVETTTEIFYVLQSSLTEPLDLSYFSCQEVNVSLAVVNRNGSSSFTSPTPLCVHGGQVAPRNLRDTAIVDDPRPRFLGHAVITLEWDPPEEGLEALTGYELFIFARPLDQSLFPGFPCGDPNMRTINISRDATSYVLMAENVGEIPMFGPERGVGGCNYLLMLTCLPEIADNDEYLEVKFNDQSSTIVTSPVEPNVTQTCSGSVDSDTGQIGISFNFSYEHDPLIEEAIVNYCVVISESGRGVSAEFTYDMNLTLIESSTKDCTPSSQFSISTTDDGVFGEVLISDLCPKEPTTDLSSHYTLAFTAFRDETMIWWRPLPRFFESCMQSGVTETPGVVDADNIMILDDPPFIREEMGQSVYIVTVSVAWEPPVPRYGAEDYEVYLGGQPIDEESEQPNNTQRVFGMRNTTIRRTLTLEDAEVIYLQIRSMNDFFMSNWSEPKNIVESTPITPVVSSSRSSLGGPTIAGIVVAVVVLVLAVGVTVLVVFLYINHRRKSKLLKSLKGNQGETLFLRYRGLERGRSNRDIIRSLLPMDDEWEIPPVAVEVEKQLGEGCFGQVYKGFVRGPIPGSRIMKDSICTTVAIKYLKANANSSERKDFVNEIEMMKRVAQGASPRVVSLIGCVTREEPLCLIVEYLKFGDLRAYLHSIKEELAMRRHVKKLKASDSSHPDAYSEGSYITPGDEREDEEESDDKNTDNDAEPYLTPLQSQPQPYLKPVSAVTMSEESPYVTLGDVEPVNLVSFAFQIAAGMEYLSSIGIVHRDLACRNVLVGEGKALKIADFGLSRVVSEGDAYVKTTAGRLPIKWMAIESISDREFTVPSDVWAFGVVVWEIATLGGFPYPSIPNEELLPYLLQGNRLENPPNCPDNIYEMMLNCWQANPAQRPTFAELRVLFESILMDASSYIQFSSLTDLTPAEKSVDENGGFHHLPLTDKASNPYVSGQNKSSPLTTPVEDTVNTSVDVKGGSHHLPLTDKSSNPYVSEPNKSSPLTTPVEDTVNTRSLVGQKVQSETILSSTADEETLAVTMSLK